MDELYTVEIWYNGLTLLNLVKPHVFIFISEFLATKLFD
jgi:hypothetical protein